MAIIRGYECMNCHLELVDDGRLFFYDESTKQTVDFIVLMNTVGMDEGSKIKGRVHETYCADCDKYLRVYTICENESGIEKPLEIIREGIDNYIKQLKEDNKYSSKLDSTIFLIEESNHEEVACPECGKKINKFIGWETQCPRCGGKLAIMSDICAD